MPIKYSAQGLPHSGGTFSKNIKFVSRCPICRSRYKNDQAQIIEELGDAHLVHIECQNCKGNVVALVVRAGVGISSVGMVTDLTAQDVFKFKDNQAISENDCIHIHHLLENYEFTHQSKREKHAGTPE